MALIVADRVQETCNSPGAGVVTLLGAVAQFQTFSAAIGNGNTTFYVIADQTGTNWEVGIGTYATTGNTLTRTTILASSNAGLAVNFASGIQNVWGDLPAGKAIYKDASGNAIGLGTPAAFVGTNITGTASGLTAGNVTTNANLTGAITSVGNATSLGSFTSANLAAALTNETGSGSAVFSDNATLLNPTYTGTLTGSTGILNIGSGQVYKDASGNVGIGTINPTAFGGKLSVVSSPAGTQSTIMVQNPGQGTAHLGLAASGSNVKLYNCYLTGLFADGKGIDIDSSGDVGIGTTNPLSKLTVYGTTGINATTGEATGVGTIRIESGSTSLASDGGLEFKIAGDSNGYGAKIQALNSSGVHLSFATRNATATWSDRMHIDPSGNVGIGTSSPSSFGRLTISQPDLVDTTTKREVFIDAPANTTTNTAGALNGITFRMNSSSYGSQFDKTSGVYGINTDTGAGGLYGRSAGLVFYTSSIDATATERMRIDSSGGLILAGSTAQKATGTTWSNPSDSRLKDNVVLYTKGLDELMQVSVKEWEYNGKGGTSKGLKGLGVIADEVMLILPNTVENYKAKLNEYDEEDSDIKKFDATEITWLMLKSIQELKAIIDTQQEQINSLVGK